MQPFDAKRVGDERGQDREAAEDERRRRRVREVDRVHERNLVEVDPDHGGSAEQDGVTCLEPERALELT